MEDKKTPFNKAVFYLRLDGVLSDGDEAQNRLRSVIRGDSRSVGYSVYYSGEEVTVSVVFYTASKWSDIGETMRAIRKEQKVMGEYVGSGMLSRAHHPEGGKGAFIASLSFLLERLPKARRGYPSVAGTAAEIIFGEVYGKKDELWKKNKKQSV